MVPAPIARVSRMVIVLMPVTVAATAADRVVAAGVVGLPAVLAMYQHVIGALSRLVPATSRDAAAVGDKPPSHFSAPIFLLGQGAKRGDASPLFDLYAKIECRTRLANDGWQKDITG